MNSAADLVIGSFELSRSIAHSRNTFKTEKASRIGPWLRATGQAAFLFLPAHGDVWSTESRTVVTKVTCQLDREDSVPHLISVDTSCAPGPASTSWNPPKKDIFSSSVGGHVRLRQQVTY